ncbi:MAG: HD domain-containing protein [Thaumarchaeota archaeon]|nr:HD domain-containing protein [Nitrososphaerota archaeon]
MGTEKKFRDPIHKFIHVSSEELKIIDTPVFQRTRNIKQLSLGYYAYHGAEHSRFGHMLGAMHVAGLAYDAIQKNTAKLGEDLAYEDIDRKTLRAAALLHDVGHAPFSHSLESLLDASHEAYSKALVKTCYEDILRKSDIDTQTVNELIDGYYTNKPHLSKLVSGQLDVDRLDYLLRDSYYAGVSYGRYDLERIIDQLAIVDGKFVVLEGGYEAVEQLVFSRYQMYQQVYFHKTKRSFELMLWKCSEIMKEDGLLHYPSIKELEEGEDGIQEYIKRDDRWFLNQIFNAKNPKVVRIADMIKARKPYLETYSPLSNRKKSARIKAEPNNSVDALEVVQSALHKALPSLGIERHEFLTDDLSRSPYNLMPDYNISDGDDGEGGSILVYYKNNRLAEPIEKRSHMVFTLAKNQPFMIRGFVTPEKYDTVRKHLETLSYVLPKRGSPS